jgi:hypothetical protein
MNKPKRPQSPERVVLTFAPNEDDPEEMERTIVLPVGFPYFELRQIGEMLEAERVFVPSYLPPKIGLCHPDAFIFEAHFESIKTILLPDRNIASRMAQIAAGFAMDSTLRKVAAIKAFCHFLDIQLEPSVAFHELAHAQGNAKANEELARFRDADNADPDPWLDLAFGDLSFLDPLKQCHEPDSLDFAFPLRRWRRNYIIALKIAELELAGGPNFNRVLKLFSWMRDDFVVGGPAALMACIYFAPNSPPRKGLLKNLRSSERSRALEGIKNAAWDLTHLSDLTRRVNEADESVRLVFASFDEGLRNLSRLLFQSSLDGALPDRLAASLRAWWPHGQASAIAEAMDELFKSIDDEDRKRRQASSPISIDEMILCGERCLSAPLVAKPSV